MLALLNMALMSWIFRCGEDMGMDQKDMWIFAELFVGGAVALLMDFEALLWVGMWRGLSHRQAYKAVLLTALQLMGPCWLFAFFLVFMKPNLGTGGVACVFALWFATGWVVDGLSIARARARLLEGFRHLAAQPQRKEEA